MTDQNENNPKSGDGRAGRKVGLWTRWKQSWKRTNNWNILLVVLTAIIAVANSIYTHYAHKQFVAMSGQLGQMESSSRQTDQLISLYRQQLDELQKQETNTHNLADAAKRQADNMNILATNQRRALEASVAASQLDQRPWVYATHFQLSNEPDIDKPFWITANLANNGKTPALESHTTTLVMWWHTEPPPTNPDQLKVSISNLLPPSSAGAAVEESEHETMNTRQLAAYKSDRLKIYFRMKTYYRDIFKQWHWTTTCVVHTYNKPLATFDLCDHGNDVGEGQ